MPPYKLSDFDYKRLEFGCGLKPFYCGEGDLDGFYKDDAIPHLDQLLAVTYFFEARDHAVGFFSVQNDSINKANSSTGIFSGIKNNMPEGKRYVFFPAVKIGRLGVHSDYQRCKIGTQIIDFIKALFIVKNKTGCRFITVDAYNKPGVLSFYQNNGFEFLSHKDNKRKTRSMYFDLITFIR